MIYEYYINVRQVRHQVQSMFQQKIMNGFTVVKQWLFCNDHHALSAANHHN